jgi:hypothetical protein
MIFQDLTGKKFNRLLVKTYVGKLKRGQSLWLCVCDCGVEKIIQGYKLTHNETKSCGCLLKENNSNYSHGMSNTPEWNSYHGAKKRCNPKFTAKYADWSGRGIEFRFNSFEEFYAEIGPRPEPKFDYSLERIDNDGHYERGNVKWATKEQQAHNRRCSNCAVFKERIKELEEQCRLMKEGKSI